MIAKILLISSFLIFMAMALEAKVKSKLGLFIVLSGVIVGILDLIFTIVQLL